MPATETQRAASREWEEVSGKLLHRQSRVTPTRQRLWAVMRELKKPENTAQIYQQNKKQLRCDLVTVYRNLELMSAAGILKKLSYGARAARYEYNVGPRAKHYIMVESTGAMHEVEAEGMKQVAENLKQLAESLNAQGYGSVTWELMLRAKEYKKTVPEGLGVRT
jgi:Fe2+ or Zn2+ uptake regulation protein